MRNYYTNQKLSMSNINAGNIQRILQNNFVLVHVQDTDHYRGQLMIRIEFGKLANRCP